MQAVTTHPSRRAGRTLRRAVQAGFTLIELMVSIVIGLFIVAAVLAIYLNMKTSFTAQDQLAQLQDSERLVLTMLTTTVQSAGYFVNPLANTAATALPAATVTRTDGSSSTFDAAQRVSGTGAGNGTTAATSDTIAVQYTTASGDGLMNCQGGTNTSGAPQVSQNYFSVNAANELTCTVGTGSPVKLAANVGAMTIIYGVDTSGSGSADTYMPASGITAGALWSNVNSAQISVTFLDTLKSKPGAPVLLEKPVVQTINLMNRSS